MDCFLRGPQRPSLTWGWGTEGTAGAASPRGQEARRSQPAPRSREGGHALRVAVNEDKLALGLIRTRLIPSWSQGGRGRGGTACGPGCSPGWAGPAVGEKEKEG